MLLLASKFISSLHGLLTTDDVAQESPQAAVETIRKSMLSCLRTTAGGLHPQLERRIQFARDVQDLWYLRGDMLIVLSSLQGESAARTQLQSISTLFEDMLPSSMHARPSRLERSAHRPRA